ncbi:hypothetical protein S7711_03664 [Stachybotrys chartarum IBT 7711]|uniref:2EXR domain-containing protein n=1 Tax=Stachybotrys chartarum (strain CBS 109288 / IBT 7711) TaxID=1280523 RepID=A0A084B7G7_STACB|nr:hypothetical protein S7711_03664 [Stachybotrys chartarum IBT 7711]KFA50095.1 hypothetical protein S40293_06379 [Stachybotrys chartarum IBT 40293]
MEETADSLRSETDGPNYGSNDETSLDAPCLMDNTAAELGDASDVTSGSAAFHPFGRLPPELRRYIWELFCPDLTLEARLLDITVAPSSDKHADECSRPKHGHRWTAKDGAILDAMTLARRRVLAVNQESRAIALQTFPDYLSLDLASGSAIVRFNKDTDLVLLTGYGMDYHASEQYHFPDFAGKITQLAISSTFGINSSTADPVDAMMDFLRGFPNLKRVFFLLESLHQNKLRNLGWCVPGFVHESFVNVSRETTELTQDNEMVFCWPVLNKYTDFYYPFRRASHVLLDVIEERVVDELLGMGIEPLPMAIFKFRSGLAHYKRLQERLAEMDADADLHSDRSLTITTSDEATSDDGHEAERIEEDPTSEEDESFNDERVQAQIE